MADVLDLRRARKRVPLPIPADATRIIGDLGGKIQRHAPATFSLRRRFVRGGVEVRLHIPGFTWSLSGMVDHYPASFDDARQWVAAYGARHGQIITEEPSSRPREVRPAGEDAKLLRAGGCREAWLRSDTPKLWAEATARCKHPGQFCGTDGFCHYGNCDMEMDPLPPEQDAYEGEPC